MNERDTTVKFYLDEFESISHQLAMSRLEKNLVMTVIAKRYQLPDTTTLYIKQHDTEWTLYRTGIDTGTTGYTATKCWFDECVDRPTHQRKKKHSGQKYKPTALDRLNQSKQAKQVKK